MFEISQLKEKKLTDLQEIAKQLSIPKYRSMKKLDLVYQILDYQAANPKAAKEVAPTAEQNTEQPAKKTRQRVQKAPKKKTMRLLKALKKNQLLIVRITNLLTRKTKSPLTTTKTEDNVIISNATKTRVATIATSTKIRAIKTKATMVIKTTETVTANRIMSLMPLLKVKVF